MVTTVGDGDVVPRWTVGRIIGAVLMLNGIALISVVTAGLMAQAWRWHGGEGKRATRAALERIEARLGRSRRSISGGGRARAEVAF